MYDKGFETRGTTGENQDSDFPAASTGTDRNDMEPDGAHALQHSDPEVGAIPF